MPTGSSLKYMMQEMPDRAFDVGIAEHNMQLPFQQEWQLKDYSLSVIFTQHLCKEHLIRLFTM